MKRHNLSLLQLALLMGVALSVMLHVRPADGAVTILQSASGTALGWEAEQHGTYINDPLVVTTPSPAAIWTPTNDAAASGGALLYTLGQNITAFPASYVDYRLQFSTPGIYKLYIRAKADVVWASADRFTANSIWIPLAFGAPFATNTPQAEASYVRSAMNASDAQLTPSSTNFQVYAETPNYEVTQAMVDSRQVVTLRVGTRERGVMLDRLVLTTDPALNETGFNAIPNSDVDIFVQPSGATHVAFEAETPKGTYINDPLVVTTPSPAAIWTPTNDAAASGGALLYTLGQNITAFPASYVDYRLQFSTPGTYKLYIRAKADVVWASADRFTANSIWIPLAFGAPFATNTPQAEASYVRSAMNASDAQLTPSSTNFQVYAETPNYEVTQAMVDSRQVVTLRVGTRERGVMLDRLVLTTDPALNETGFNSLPNTALDNIAPQVASVTPSLSFTNVVISFDEAISPGSIDSFNFGISGGLSVLGVGLDSATLRKLTIHTSPQTPDTTYTLTFGGVADVSGNVVPAGSQVTFRSWRLQTGWVTREIYAGIAGGTVNELVASPRFPDSPNSIDASPGVTMVNNPRGNNYGMRIRFFFIPPVTDGYDFYVYADDQAEVSVSTDDSAANLTPVIATSVASSAYDPAVNGTIPFQEFIAGQRYLVQVLYKQGSGEGRLGVAAARPSGGGGAELPPLIELSGNVIATYINPATASIDISRHPQNTSVTVGHSASFSAAATSPAGAVAYQWQVDGVNIPGANRPVYITPALAFADGARRYRVVVTAGGAAATSTVAQVTINAGQPPTALPYVGINFVGGGGSVEGVLSAPDIAGAVPQANFNNVEGAAQTAAPLNDATGSASPVTITYAGAIRYTGAGNVTAENALFEGYIQNNTQPLIVTLSGVPPGNYGLLAYCVGFDFQTVYDQGYQLIGAATYPEFHVRGQTASEYRASPGYRRMSSTNPNARDTGNYVMFENIAPDGSGNFTLTMTFEMQGTPGVTDSSPALNALQLVRIVPPLPVLSITRNVNGTAVVVSWDAGAAGYTLESSNQFGVGAIWNPVGGVANPLAASGATVVNTTGGARFFRLHRQ